MAPLDGWGWAYNEVPIHPDPALQGRGDRPCADNEFTLPLNHIRNVALKCIISPSNSSSSLVAEISTFAEDCAASEKPRRADLAGPHILGG